MKGLKVFLPDIITSEEVEILKNIDIDRDERDNDHPVILKIRNIIDEVIIRNSLKPLAKGGNWNSPSYIIKEKHGKHGWHYDTGVHYIVDNEAVPVLATGHMTWCDFGCSILLTDNETAGYLEYRDGTKLLPKKHYCGLAIHSSDVEHRVVDASSKRHTLLFFLQRKL